MSDLARWTEKHIQQLIDAAAARMAQSASVRSQAEEAVHDFFEAFAKTARLKNEIPLHAILIDWIEARAAPVQEETAGLLPALFTLKQVMWDQIVENSDRGGEATIALLRESDAIFAEAASFLAKLEAEALLNDVRADLDKAQKDLERLDKNKSNFIAVAAHELKTPLTLIEGYTNMMKSEFPPEQYPRLALIAEGVGGGARRLRDIINDMIDVSMIDMQLLDLRFQPTWVYRLVDSVEYDMRDILKERNLTLVIERDKISKEPTFADSERLHQVIIKIVANAIKYTPDGGTITISARDLPGFMDLTVTDTGIGIDSENLTRIFEKFSSLSEVATHSSSKVKFKGGGPGLGLAIAQGIIEAHGGTIWAYSDGYDEEKCPGSTFHIMIPMRSAPPDDQMARLFRSGDDR